MGDDIGIANRLREGFRLVSACVQKFSEHGADYQGLLGAIAREVALAIPDTCMLTLRDAETHLVPVAFHDADPGMLAAFASVLGTLLSTTEPALALKALARGPQLLSPLDYDALRDRMPDATIERLRKIGARSMLVVPLAARGELLGAISVVRYRPEHEPLDELDLEIVNNLAQHVALSISHTRLVSQLHHSEELRAAEERAVQASLLVDAIVENIPDMVFVKDADKLAFVRFNRAGEALLGVSREELFGKTDFDFFPASEAEFFVAKDRETLAAKALVEILEEPIQTRNGPRWLHTKKVPLVDAAGVPRYLLGISHDITDRKRAVEELRDAKEVAESANRELEAFSYSVAHDLRAPLRVIDAFSRAVLEDHGAILPEEGRHHLERVLGATKHMAVLIDDLLALSRVTRGELQHSQVDLSALANDTISVLRHANPERDVEVVITPGLVVDADRRMMAIAFTNLFDNAWKFTSKRDHARIELGAATNGDDRTFFIRDNGAGFDMKHADKLFGVFQRLHSDAEFTGTGIGLATVARIVRRHRGRVWAEGEPGKGATVYFTLPRN